MDSSSSSSSSLYQQSSHHWTMDEEHGGGGGGLDMVSSSSDVSSVAVSSDDSDVFEEVNSSSGSSSPRSPDSSSGKLANGPLHDMSSLLQQLPFKRGLSKHYNGKSQSFTSLANVKCLEDLAKPENPYNERLKSCKSYALFESHRSSSQSHRSNSSSRLISDKPSRGSCSSLSIVQRNNGSFLGNRPPFPPPHRSPSTTTFANQTPLFA